MGKKEEMQLEIVAVRVKTGNVAVNLWLPEMLVEALIFGEKLNWNLEKMSNLGVHSPEKKKAILGKLFAAKAPFGDVVFYCKVNSGKAVISPTLVFAYFLEKRTRNYKQMEMHGLKGPKKMLSMLRTVVAMPPREKAEEEITMNVERRKKIEKTLKEWAEREKKREVEEAKKREEVRIRVEKSLLAAAMRTRKAIGASPREAKQITRLSVSDQNLADFLYDLWERIGDKHAWNAWMDLRRGSEEEKQKVRKEWSPKMERAGWKGKKKRR